MEEFNSLGTWVCWEIYYAGCDLHQPRLLSKAILWECQNATPHCSIHIKSVLFASLTLLKTGNFIQCWKDCECVYSPADTGIQKTNFLLIFQGKGSPESQKMKQTYVLVCQKGLKSLFTCLDRVKDTVKYSLPKHIFTSVLRPWVVLQKPICLSAVINNSSVLLWFSTHQRALPSKAAVPGSRCWHWKQKIQMPISQLSERQWE